MAITFEQDVIEPIFAKYNCTDLDYYVLVNNTGCAFTLNSHRYDARHWRNIYGVSVNRWEILSSDGGVKDQTIQQLEQELNSLGLD